MSVSGVEVPEEIKSKIQAMIQKKTMQYLVFRLESDVKTKKNEWKIKAEGARIAGAEGQNQIAQSTFCKEYAAFIKDHFTEEEPLFALYDFSVCRIHTENKLNVLGIQWCPDACKVTKKMIFASSVASIKTEAESSTTLRTPSEMSELTYESVSGLAVPAE